MSNSAQHTQTHSTRLVALASDNKRKSIATPTIPLPIQPTPTLIKIEDSISTNANVGINNPLSTIGHHPSAFEAKSTSLQAAASITTAVQTNDISSDIAALNNSIYYQTHGLHSNLIQIASHPTTVSSLNSHSTTSLTGGGMMNSMQSTPNILTPPETSLSSMPCITSIDSFSRSDDNLDSSGVSSLPEGEFDHFQYILRKQIFFHFRL